MPWQVSIIFGRAGVPLTSPYLHHRPSQGFIEITIKDLENVLHVEISRFWSKGLISVFTDSRSQFDPTTNSLTKLGENLKVGDIMLRKFDREGLPCKDERPWKVVELVYTKLLGVDDLKVGEEYGVYYRPEQVVLPFNLVEVDLNTKTYHFQSSFAGAADLRVSVHDLPSVYPAGTGMKAHADVNKVIVECLEKNKENGFSRLELLMNGIKKRKFTLHIGNCHVVEAIGSVVECTEPMIPCSTAISSLLVHLSQKTARHAGASWRNHTGATWRLLLRRPEGLVGNA